MATGLLALLDDVAAIAKLAAASLDDAAAQATKATGKAAGIVIDDAAVTPRYVVGLTADREIPIIARIAVGSLKNKLLLLTPAALALSQFAKPAITPLLMGGGAFLCLEGFHKIVEVAQPHAEEAAEDAAPPLDAETLEREKVKSAVRTDVILSAEIMAITLASVSTLSLAMQAAVLIAVGIAMTVLVYGVVALIVKADDAGAALARSGNGALQAIGRGLVKAMPKFLKGLSGVGLVAMLWVGGGIVAHGAHELGWHLPEDLVKGASRALGGGVPGWFAGVVVSSVLGVVIGAIVAGFVDKVAAPVLKSLRRKDIAKG